MTERQQAGLDVFKTLPKPPRLPKPKRQPTKFEIWAWSQVISFQIGLTGQYLAMVFFGVAAFVSGVPAFRLTAPDNWYAYWAALLVVGGAVAALGSVSRIKVFFWMELSGATLITLTVGSYAAVLLFMAHIAGDADRGAAGAGFTALAVPVAVRLMWLASQIFRK